MTIGVWYEQTNKQGVDRWKFHDKKLIFISSWSSLRLVGESWSSYGVLADNRVRDKERSRDDQKIRGKTNERRERGGWEKAGVKKENLPHQSVN